MRQDSAEDRAHFQTMEADTERLTMGDPTDIIPLRDEKLHAGRIFSTGATRDADEGKFDYEAFSAPIVEHTYASYMHDNRKQVDGVIRDGDNWQNGMPRRQYMKSLIRHVFDLWYAWRQAPGVPAPIVTLLCAIRFNVNGLLFEILIDREVGE